MKHRQKCYLLILAATIAALALRLPRLEQRPMHTDEAVHAIKFGDLLEKGRYTYNPREFHGPTLNYLTLVPAWLSSAEKPTQVREFTLRAVPVFFGVLLVLLTLTLVDGLGWAAVCVAVLTAVSPAMVFYSRYYIQEMLLVCFTFGVITCGYHYIQSKSTKWALPTGVFLGLCHATKETSIIAFGCMLLAILLTLLLYRWQRGSALDIKRIVKPWHVAAAAATAVVVSALFYSSFLGNVEGILDSLRAYATYFSRAGENDLHIHPWYYYLKMLIYSRYAGGPAWSEGLIVILAVAGFVIAMTKRDIAGADFHLLRFIAFYTFIMTVLYSLIPYKTPWCLLGFLHGMIILAAVGAVAVIRLAPNVLARTTIGLLLAVSGGHLAWQAYLSSYRYYANPANPYVYAHTGPDIYTIVQRVKDVAVAHPHGRKMPIQVICPGHDYWPLPWYLRRFDSVGYWDHVNMDVPAAPVIIASPSVEPDLGKKLYELPPEGERRLYMRLFDRDMELRPQIRLRGYIRKDVWDNYRQYQAQ
jgi:uncharacterized protein (TIGR03663 family)